MKFDFLYKALCEEKGGKFFPSSKRLAGIIGWIVCQLCIGAAVILELVLAHELSGTTSSLVITDLSISAALIGLKTIATAFQGNDTKVSDEPIKEE